MMMTLSGRLATEALGTGLPEDFSEFVATFGLIATIVACVHRRPTIAPFAVGLHMGSAYWFTAFTSFANPAMTLPRAAADTFAGIRPTAVSSFIAAQLIGMAAAVMVFRWLPPRASVAARSD